MFENKSQLDAWKQLMKAGDESSLDIPCTNYPDAFFPEKGEKAEIAKSLCRECPILTQCAQYGLEFEYEHGIFGGLTVDERWRIRRAMDARRSRRRTADQWLDQRAS